MGITWVAPRPLKGGRQRNRRKGRDQSNRQLIKQTISLCLRGEGQRTKNIVMFDRGQSSFIRNANGIWVLLQAVSCFPNIWGCMSLSGALRWLHLESRLWELQPLHYIWVHSDGRVFVGNGGCLHSKNLPYSSLITLKMLLAEQ